MATFPGWEDDSPPPPEEYPTTLWVNGQELVTIQATRVHLWDWAVGFLFTEGIIADPQDVLDLRVDELEGRIWTRVAWPGTGAAAGVCAPVTSPVRVTPAQLAGYQARMQRAAVRYATTGGMHVAAVFRVPTGAMLAREDIGRHNAVDKAIGAALSAGWDPEELVLLTSGRISYEMCSKVARFGIGLAASRSAATDQAVRLAHRLGIALIGYLRPHGLRAYTGRHRLEAATCAGAGRGAWLPQATHYSPNQE